MSVFEKIAAQQKGKEDSPVWMLGEQLKDICKAEPESAALVDKDIEAKGMGLVELEKKLKALADEKHKKSKGNVCITALEAEKVIREFYGLPERGEPAQAPAPAPSSAGLTIDISDFL